ncbi:unnamed protein product, partial [Prorocentrum cordatum]
GKVYGKPAASSRTNKHPLHGLRFPKDPPSAADDVTQVMVKPFFPPDTCVWRSNGEGAWLFNQPSIKKRGRRTRAQHGGSSQKAVRACMVEAWANFLEELQKENRLRVADAWDYGQVVVRGPSWDSGGHDSFDGGSGASGYTIPPSEEQIQEWLKVMLFGHAEGISEKCNMTGWHMQHHWINRSIVAEFPAGCGQKVFKAGDGHRFELSVVDGFSLQSDVDRFCSLHTTMMHVRKSFTDWLPTYVIAHNIQHENYNRIRELEEASIQWIKDGMQQKLNERI